MATEQGTSWKAQRPLIRTGGISFALLLITFLIFGDALLALQKEELFANKIHAYTRPRLTENSQVEDLVDMALLIADGLVVERVKLAISGVFKASADHRKIPVELPLPPDSWEKEFGAISYRRNPNLTIEQAFEVVFRFYSGLPGDL